MAIVGADRGATSILAPDDVSPSIHGEDFEDGRAEDRVEGGDDEDLLPAVAARSDHPHRLAGPTGRPQLEHPPVVAVSVAGAEAVEGLELERLDRGGLLEQSRVTS